MTLNTRINSIFERKACAELHVSLKDEILTYDYLILRGSDARQPHHYYCYVEIITQQNKIRCGIRNPYFANNDIILSFTLVHGFLWQTAEV